MIWKRLFDPQPRSEQAWPLYEIVVAQARSPGLYREFGLPDSLDGRFESIVLHLVLVLRRLKRDFPTGLDLAEALQEVFFTDMDRSLREMGAGDLGVGKRVKRMAEGFMGRLTAYESALDAVPARGSGELEEVLRRNAFGTLEEGVGDSAGLAAYVMAQMAALEAQDGEALRQGRLAFAAAPGQPVEG
ncbi:MAG: ubiquinol-cytochrome C chaperone family protein [Kiloniellaceae bacterium]